MRVRHCFHLPATQTLHYDSTSPLVRDITEQTSLHKRCSQDLRELLRFCVAWKATFPQKRSGSSSPAGVSPMSFVETVWSICPKPSLFGRVKHYRQVHEFTLLRLIPVQLPH